MIKKHQKWIAVSVVFAFLCLLQVSTMPLRAEQSSGQSETTMKSAEQGPSFVEQEGAPYAAKKKSIVPIVLIGVGVVAVAAVLIFVVFKTKYNIVGTWNYSWKNAGDATWKYTGQKVVCTGDKKSGTLTYNIQAYPGTYTVDGKNVVLKFVYNSNSSVTHTGTFNGKDKIAGTWVYDQDTTNNGSFEMTRVATTTSAATPLAAGEAPGKNDRR